LNTKIQLERPGWPELLTGLAVFLVLLLPTAIAVGFFQGQPALQGMIGSTAGGVAGVGGFAAAFAIRIRALRPFGFVPVSWRWIVIASGLAVVGYGLNLLIQFVYVSLIGDDNPQGVLHAAAQGGALAFTLSLIGGALFTPFGEEILFRGVIANALNRYGAWAGVGVSAVIFGLVHGVSVILPVAIMVGVLSAILFRRTGSIWPCVALHCVYNGTNSLASALGFTPFQ